MAQTPPNRLCQFAKDVVKFVWRLEEVEKPLVPDSAGTIIVQSPAATGRWNFVIKKWHEQRVYHSFCLIIDIRVGDLEKTKGPVADEDQRWLWLHAPGFSQPCIEMQVAEAMTDYVNDVSRHRITGQACVVVREWQPLQVRGYT